MCHSPLWSQSRYGRRLGLEHVTPHEGVFVSIDPPPSCSYMDADMDIPLFFRVSTMAALSTSTLLPLDNVMSMEMGKAAARFDPINVPDVIRLRSEQDCEEAFQLLLSVLRQPELGLYIRHIDILRDTQFHGYYKPTPHQRFISGDDCLLLRLAVRNAGWYGAEEELILNMLLQRHFDLDFSNGFHSYVAPSYLVHCHGNCPPLRIIWCPGQSP